MLATDTSRREAEHGRVMVCTRSLWLVPVHQLQRSCLAYRATGVEADPLGAVEKAAGKPVAPKQASDKLAGVWPVQTYPKIWICADIAYPSRFCRV